MKRCKWHCCNRKFEPSRPAQDYCSTACRMRRLEWAKARGSRVLNAILGAGTGILDVAKAERKALRDEISEARKRHGRE